MQKYLVFKKDGEDGPDVKGGELDALIVHASKVQKICENGKIKFNIQLRKPSLISSLNGVHVKYISCISHMYFSISLFLFGLVSHAIMFTIHPCI